MQSPIKIALAILALPLLLTACVQAVVASEDSTTYRLNPSHSAQITMPDFVGPVGVKWDVAFSAPGGYIAYPIVAGNKVFVVASSNIYPYQSYLYAFSASSGVTMWQSAALPTSNASWSVPAYDGGRVFISNGSVIIAYDAATGNISWSSTILSYGAAVTPWQGNLYLSSRGNLISVRETDGSVIWSKSISSSGTTYPTLTPNGLFIGTPCQQSDDLDIATGAVKWSVNYPCSGYGSTTESFFANRIFAPAFATSSNAQQLFDAAIDPSTGALLQSLPVQGTLAFDGYYAFSVDSTNAVVATNLTTASIAWTAPNGIDIPATPPIIVNNALYVATFDGLLKAYTVLTGAVAFTVPLGETFSNYQYNSNSELSAGDGIILVTVGNHLVAVGTPFAIVSASLSPPKPNGSNGWYTKPVAATLTTTAGTLSYSLDGGAAQTYTSPITISSDAKHTLTYSASDAQGDKAKGTPLAINIDGTPPVSAASVTGRQLVTGDFAVSASVSINASDNLSGVASVTYNVDGGTPQLYTAPFNVVGTGSHIVRFFATDVAGNAQAKQSVTFKISPAIFHTFAISLSMISAPADYTGSTLAQIFDQPVTLAAWNPATGTYTNSPTAPANTIAIGTGYWARFKSTTDLLDIGTKSTPTQAFSIPLKRGWNLIGEPWPTPAALSSLDVVDASGNVFAVGVPGSIIAPVAYTWQTGDTAYEAVTGSGALVPFDGYWVYAYQPGTLEFPGTPNPPNGPTGLGHKH